MRFSWRLAGLAGVLLVGSACQRGSFHIPFMGREPGLLQAWGEALRRQGVHPMLPLREDVQVGDIYLSRVPPEGEDAALADRGFISMDLFLARVDLSEEIGRFYASRYLFPETRAFGEGGGAPDRSTFEEGGSGRGADRRMMRLVTFPAFATVNVSKSLKDAELFQFVPPEALAFLQKSGGWGRGQTLTVGTTMAESYGLPAEAATRDFAKAYGESDALARLVEGGIGPSPRSAKGKGKGPSVPTASTVYIRLITEVYSVRSLDIVLRTDLKASFADGYGGQGPNLERMNRMLQQNPQASQGGGQLRFISFGPEGVAMRRIFARPLVVGYRGVVIRVNTLDRSAELHGLIEARTPLPK